jgi:hypothetical protein
VGLFQTGGEGERERELVVLVGWKQKHKFIAKGFEIFPENEKKGIE